MLFDVPNPTPEQAVVKDVFGISNEGLESLKNSVRNAYNRIWSSGLSPQSMFDAAGNQASKILFISAEAQKFIKLLDPSWEFLASPYHLTPNQDGTVTVGDLK